MLLKFLMCYQQGIWGGMIFGGTAVQTIILVIITMRTNWEQEVNVTMKLSFSITLIYFI